MIHGNPLFILLLCLVVLEKLLQVTEPHVQAPLSIKEWDLRSLDYGKVGLLPARHSWRSKYLLSAIGQGLWLADAIWVDLGMGIGWENRNKINLIPW